MVNLALVHTAVIFFSTPPYSGLFALTWSWQTLLNSLVLIYKEGKFFGEKNLL